MTAMRPACGSCVTELRAVCLFDAELLGVAHEHPLYDANVGRADRAALAAERERYTGPREAWFCTECLKIRSSDVGRPCKCGATSPPVPAREHPGAFRDLAKAKRTRRTFHRGGSRPSPMPF
jgi:hypothetical protein